jgi:hypothetical protein
MAWWLVVAAWSAPVERGLQARVFPPALDFAAQELVETPISIGPEELVTEFECYFEVNVENFNLVASMESIDLLLEDGQLQVDIDFGTVIGYDIHLAAYSGWLDLCIDFDATLLYLELENGHLTGQLAAVPGPTGIELAFIGEPELTGVLDSDISGFPDDLLWVFFNGLVKSEIEKVLTTEIPNLLEVPISGAFASPFGELALDVAVVDVEMEAAGLYAAADVDLGGEGNGRAPHILMEPRGQSHVAVALTDGVLQELVGVTWGSGALAESSPISQLLLDELSSTLGLPDDVTTSLSVGGVPSVTVGSEVVTMVLPGTTLEAYSGGELLLRLVADLSAEVETRVEASQGSILLSAHEVAITVQEIDADALVASEDGEAHLADFLEGWVADAVSDAIDQTPVFTSQFLALGYVLLLDEVELIDKSVVAWFTVYRSDDPAVDIIPPGTEVAVEVSDAGAVAQLGGDDDRPGELSYKWRVDGGSWSHWGWKTTVTLAGLAPGPHVVEAVSRDAWQNEDPTPASAEFSIAPPTVTEPLRTCGCAHSPAASSLAGLGWLALMVCARRTQRGAAVRGR